MTPKPASGYVLVIVPEVREWLHDLRKADKETSKRVASAIAALLEVGPGLGRPLADTLSRDKRRKRARSRYSNMKELRPTSGAQSAVRILFIFDPSSRAVLLVAGDKAGNWEDWYEGAIPLADARYEAHLKAMEGDSS
ncbi:type II toxin-antitoxin system RelE/ParE family toxin [Streptomyces massasporeus]|uniref:type II toxin-antitoxin system RelE/ParE family toxin n=1 Tax=Streptomyces massasporeus TaxID=67324 RepID=UPI0033DC07BD